MVMQAYVKTGSQNPNSGKSRFWKPNEKKERDRTRLSAKYDCLVLNPFGQSYVSDIKTVSTGKDGLYKGISTKDGKAVISDNGKVWKIA